MRSPNTASWLQYMSSIFSFISKVSPLCIYEWDWGWEDKEGEALAPLLIVNLISNSNYGDLLKCLETHPKI